jgi:hypothetical protein
MVVHQNDVSTGHFAQNTAGKHTRVSDNRIMAPNTPGYILQPRILQRKTQQRMTQADRGAEVARPYSADALNALRAAFDLISQASRREKTE